MASTAHTQQFVTRVSATKLGFVTKKPKAERFASWRRRYFVLEAATSGAHVYVLPTNPPARHELII